MIALRTALLAFAAVLPAACIGLQREPPQRQQYLVDVVRPNRDEAPAGAPGLTVRPFRVDAATAGEAFVYRLGGGEVEQDYYHGWFVPPSSMLGETTRRWLRHSGLFSFVDEGGSQLRAPYVLEGDLLDLYVDVSDPKAPAAVLAVHVLVVDTDDDRPILQRDYRELVPIGADEPEAAVAGWSRALTAMLTKLEADMRDVLADADR